MSKEFIESGFGNSSVNKAFRQEKQLNYFTYSKIQDDYLTEDYIQNWVARKYETTDYFLNYVKNIFKDENFLTFFKYLRFPLPSAKLIQNKIIPDLKRVFWSENSIFRYDVTGIDSTVLHSELEINDFNKYVFDAILFKHNSILITDLRSDVPNSPYRSLIPIEDVVSITLKGDDIDKIAFKANVNGENGYMYIDSEKYSFYNHDFQEISSATHDLGQTPALFISQRKFGDDPIVRASLFSYIREELEEYVFMKTLQKMTDPNGAIPVVTYLKSSDKKEKSLEPDMGDAMSAQKAGVQTTLIPKGEGITQVGSTIGIPIVRKADGSIDMDVVKYYMNFHYIPTESLNYINKRVKEIEKSIVTTLVGDVINSDEIAKNESQIEKSISVLENTLRELSLDLSRVRQISDYIFLALRYGKEQVNEVTIFYGSDFFLESENMLYNSFTKAPNPIERKNILLKISQNRYRDNSEQLNRQQILYNLLPYSSDKDFEKAVEKEMVDSTIFDYQSRFNYWVSEFEANYGDIVTFFNSTDNSPAEKYKLINNLIINLIKNGNSQN